MYACTNEEETGSNQIVIKPVEYEHALRNPLKGFRGGYSDRRELSTLAKSYIRWNAIENEESDAIDKIREYCNKLWREGGNWRALPDNSDRARPVEEMNIKVVPRVFLHWDKNLKYWPADMQPDDYSSEQFKKRVVRLIERLGELWDNDPRVAFIEMGFIGKWGEHHSPSVIPEMQKLLGDAFTRAFKNKLVAVRHPQDFQQYQFGIYWDSWAHTQQMDSHGAGIAKLGDRWKTAVIAGEAAYNWGKYEIQPGESPTDTVKDPEHREFFIDTIRWLHCNHLDWVSAYDQNDPEARRGAEEVQKALGYRFVIDEVRYPAKISPGRDFKVSFTVRNTGSGPLYYNWPVEVSLLDIKTRKPVWKETFKDVDVRSWLPGDQWNMENNEYRIKPETYLEEDTFTLPKKLEKGEYVLALAILDPAGMLPGIRFAIRNYYTGGRHPIGLAGVGKRVKKAELDERDFDDLAKDTTLHYSVNRK